MMGPPRWVEPYLGIHGIERGDDFDGCHCWGLVRLIYRRQREISLPPYMEIGAREALKVARAMRIERSKTYWERRFDASWCEFDVVLMASFETRAGKTRRYPGHVGIAVASNLLLHVEPDLDSICMERSDPRIARRILGAYRYRS